MTNVKSLSFFVAGSVILSVLLCLQTLREESVANAITRTTLSTISPDEADSFEIKTESTHLLFRKSADREWTLSIPFPCSVDEPSLYKMLDVFLQTHVGDVMSDDDLRSLDKSVYDFGLAPARAKIFVKSGVKTERIHLGAATPSGEEVYARVEGLKNVFTVPMAVYAAVSNQADAFRQREITRMVAADMSVLEFRSPGVPFIRLVRGVDQEWKIEQPAPSPADSHIVETIAEALVSARAESFVWPIAVEGKISSSEAVPLEPYGLGDDAALSVTMRTASDKVEQIVFGAVAPSVADSTNSCVYALVNGKSVVTLDASLLERCRTGFASLKDMRVFPVSEGDLTLVSLRVDKEEYTLVRDTNRLWKISSPVVAMADQRFVAELVGRILRVKENSVSEKAPLTVSVSVGATALRPVRIPPEALGDIRAFSDMRSKTIVEFDSSKISRLTCRTAAGLSYKVSRAEDSDGWVTDAVGSETSARIIDADSLDELLKALGCVVAESVEVLSASDEDLARCGLDVPAIELAVDSAEANVVRQKLLFGKAAPGGGRYVTVGGSDAIFIISAKAMRVLTAPLVK